MDVAAHAWRTTLDTESNSATKKKTLKAWLLVEFAALWCGFGIVLWGWEKQIPCGNDRQKGKGKCNCKSKGKDKS